MKRCVRVFTGILILSALCGCSSYSKRVTLEETQAIARDAKNMAEQALKDAAFAKERAEEAALNAQRAREEAAISAGEANAAKEKANRMFEHNSVK